MSLAVARTGANFSSGVFTPQIYSAKLQDKFYAASVVPAVANHNWEGDILAFGDKVLIRKVPTVSISDYSVNGTISYQAIADDQVILNIDKAKYYAFKVDYVDDYQADLALIDLVTNDAAQNMAVAVDKSVLQTVYSDPSTANTVGATGAGDTTPIQLSTLNTATYINPLLQAGQVLDENNVPRDGMRWAIINPTYARYLKLSDLKQVLITGDDESPLRNGFVGQIDGMNVYVSNNLLNAVGATVSAPCEMLVGHHSALAFASQFVKHEMLPLQDTFGWGVKGLQVYGFKTVKPEAMVRLRAY